MPEIIEAPFRLMQDDPVITSTDKANGVASTWSDMWTYQVPVGMSLIIKPEHTFSAYLDEGTGSTESGASHTSIRIEKRDASGSDKSIIFGPKLYSSVKQFVNVDRLAHFNVPPEGVIINEREKLVIVVYTDAIVVEAYCYWEAHIAKVRKAIGA